MTYSFSLAGYEVMRQLAAYPLTEVTVDVGGILIDVCAIAYDPDRDKTVLKVFPEDLTDAIRRMFDNLAG